MTALTDGQWEPPIGWAPEDPPIQGLHLVDLDAPVRDILGDLTNTLAPCSGGCGIRVLKYQEWQKLGKEERTNLRKLGVNRTSSFGRCWKCTEADPTSRPEAAGNSRKYYGKKVSAEMKTKIPEIWEQIQIDGGATKELGERLGVTRERARQLVKELGLPHRDRRGATTREFVEDLEHLFSFGLGAHEIAQKLGTNADALVRQIDRLRARGLTTVSFPTYFRYYDVDSESRVSARNQRVHDKEQAA